ncbi:MAG: DUF3048 domain-containing protein [Candidatus Moranbacteria bacterium]|nr:DUF3048 domain-containing protein [Candidatus Moranbacteria bacterium]
MDFQKQKVVYIAVGVLVILFVVYFAFGRGMLRKNRVEPIEVTPDGRTPVAQQIVNDGPVSPISGLSCENWNRRPLAVMQPSDVPARPVAGFSEADMVIEMPVITSSVTRLMGVYVCNTPPEVGSMRSARHDFIHLAKGLDAIFAPWGRSESHTDTDPVGLAQGILNRGEIDNINCNQDAGISATRCSTNPCFRKEGMDRGVDSGFGNPADFYTCAEELGYRLTNEFGGYPHQAESSVDSRPEGGRLRVAYGGSFAVDYDYNRESNSYDRIWGGVIDKDRNNGQRISPKNIAVLFARSEQIEGQYNNVQLGDPWYDDTDTGEAYYYFNGQELRGTWKKDKGSIDSKLFFYDNGGQEVKFVPGQIWVSILEPGQSLKWTPGVGGSSQSGQNIPVE